jgi:hypothetical protein
LKNRIRRLSGLRPDGPGESFLGIVAAFVFLLSAPLAGKADVIVNEVMSNEPGRYRSLEWIEIYNNSDACGSLGACSLIIQGASDDLPRIDLAPFQFVILCQRLYGEDGSPGFESHWGDSSGIWGDDTARENYLVLEFPTAALVNDSGLVILECESVSVSRFKWTEAGRDGVSWERYRPGDSLILNCVYPRGSTPGRMNSVTPREHDLCLLRVTGRRRVQATFCVDAVVVNSGLQSSAAAGLSVLLDSDGDSTTSGGSLEGVLDIPGINSGDTAYITGCFDLPGVHPLLFLVLPEDDNPENNSRFLPAFGNNFPPVSISEFIADPSGNLSVEWVELQNHSEIDVNLDGWCLGDEIRFYPITSFDCIVKANEYIVLCRDTTALFDFYSSDRFSALEMASWAVLNDGGDQIRLKDNFGFAADSFRYEHGFGDNYSWGKGEEPSGTSCWGRAIKSGGTPGRPNEVHCRPSSTRINLFAEPNPLSLSKGRPMTIGFTVPQGGQIAIRVYDLQGRVVKTLLEDLPAFNGSVQWDGSADSGRPLRIGMYVLYIEVAGVEKHKQTIVIAP